MSPLIDQAVEFLIQRAKAREAKTALARRVYFRAILLGESPPGGAQTLADAVEHLDLNHYDLSNDAHHFAIRQACLDGISALDQKTADLLAAARKESPQWVASAYPLNGTQWGPNVLAAQAHLATRRRDDEDLRLRADQARLRAPRVFSPDARKFTESPIEPPKGGETPPQADHDNNSDIDMADQEFFDESLEDAMETQPDATADDSAIPHPQVPEPQIPQPHQAPPPAQYAW